MSQIRDYQHKSSPYLYSRVQHACWGAFQAGYTISELGIAFGHLALLYDIHESDQRNYCTLVVTILSASALISAYLSQFLMHKMERRKFMVIADLFFLLASGLTQISEWWVFMFARLVMGISVGMNTSVISLYIREISPDNMAGKTGALFQANVNLGIIFGFILNLPLKNVTNVSEVTDIWRLVFLFPAFFSVIRIFFMLFIYNIDTPYYYYRNHLNTLGRKAIEQIYKEKYVLSQEQIHIAPGSVDFTDMSTGDQTLINESEQSYKNRLKVGMVTNFLQQMCGNTYLAVYSTGVLGIVTSDFYHMRSFVLGSYIFLFFVSTLGVSFNRKLARKRYLIGGFLFCALCQTGLAIIASFKDDVQNNSSLQFLLVLFLFFFYAAYNFSVGPVTSIFTSDILKDEGMSYSIVMNWLGNVISLTLFLNTQVYVNCIVFALSAFCGFTFCLKYVVETRYMNFNDIQKTYQNNYEMNVKQQLDTSQVLNDSVNNKSIVCSLNNNNSIANTKM
ncbi:hypothetical protein ABPG72_003799 [Tetrahymena utriculariae]